MRYRSFFLGFKGNSAVDFSRFIFKKKNSAGRNATGVITCFSKGRRVANKTVDISLPYYENVNYLVSNRFFDKKKKKYFNLLKTAYGSQYCVPAVYGSDVGSLIFGVDVFTKSFSVLRIGFPVFIKYVPQFFKFSNLFFKENSHVTYATSPGTYCTRIKISKKEKLSKIVLPSSEFKFLPKNTLCLLGRNINAFKNKYFFGKAGCMVTEGYKSSVRGVAMNPVDHPNGGRAKSCQPERSP